MAIRVMELRGIEPGGAAVHVQHFHGRDLRPGLAAPGTGVHRQRPTDRPRNARHEPEAGARTLLRELGEAGAVHAGFRIDLERPGLDQASECVVQRDGRARPAAVAHQQIAAQAQPQQRFVRRQSAHEGDQVFAVGRFEVAAGGPADAPARVARQGFVLDQQSTWRLRPASHRDRGARGSRPRRLATLAGSHRLGRLLLVRGLARRAHAVAPNFCTSSAGAAPMSPAPIVSSRS